jgi:hypothetical protein
MRYLFNKMNPFEKFVNLQDVLVKKIRFQDEQTDNQMFTGLWFDKEYLLLFSRSEM